MQAVTLVKVDFLPPDMEQDCQIMVACRQINDKLLSKHLNQPRSPNFEDANAKTPLFVAASNGSLQCVLLLLEAGAERDKGRVDIGATPLLIAAGKGHLEVVRLLVESGANKDQGTTDDGMAPLFAAADQGHLEVVQFLVESGANKDQGTTDTGSTPLLIAAHKGHLEVVQFLVESGANTNQGTTDDGTTPLSIAAQNGHLEVVRFLVESGANNEQGQLPIEYEDFSHTGFQRPIWSCVVFSLVWGSEASKDQGHTGQTLLDAATLKPHHEIVRFFVVPCHENLVCLL